MDGVGENDKGGQLQKSPFSFSLNGFVCFFDTSGDFSQDGTALESVTK